MILIATDHSFKFFGETIDNIRNSKLLEKYNERLKKTFPELAQKEKKMYQDEIIDKTISDDKSYFVKKKESFETINFLINEINAKKNWIVKIVYFDTYFDMIVPKCVIENGIKILELSVGNLEKKNNDLKVNIECLEKKNNDLKVNIECLEKKNNDLKENIKGLEKKNNDLKVNVENIENKNNVVISELKMENNVIKESIENLEKKNNIFKDNIESLQNQNKNLSNKIDNMISVFTKFLPGINISELIKEINDPKKKLDSKI